MIITGNEFALAQTATHLAIAWHKATPESDFRDQEIEKLTGLARKLDELLDDNQGVIEFSDGECDFEVRDYQDLTPRC